MKRVSAEKFVFIAIIFFTVVIIIAGLLISVVKQNNVNNNQTIDFDNAVVVEDYSDDLLTVQIGALEDFSFENISIKNTVPGDTVLIYGRMYRVTK